MNHTRHITASLALAAHRQMFSHHRLITSFMKTTTTTLFRTIALVVSASFLSSSPLQAQTVVGGDGANTTVSTVYSGSQSITKIGSNTVTLSGDNSYTGLTSVNQGRLVLGAGSGDYRFYASDFAINNASILSFGGVRFDLNNQTTGTVRTITFDAGGGNTFDTGTGVNLVDWHGSTYRSTGGMINFMTGSSGVNMSGSVVATLEVARGTDPEADLMVVTRFWNGGSLRKTGDGIAILTGANSYAGTTTIAGGTLQVGNGGTTGTLGAGAVTNNATLVFNRSDDTIVGNAISGTGAVIKSGTGTLQFSADNSYTGLTTVNQGRLVLGRGSGDYRNNASDFLITNGSTLAFSGARFDLNRETTGTARTITFGAGGGNTFDTGASVNIVDWHGNTYRTTGGARNFIAGSSGLNITAAQITLDVARGTDAATDLLVSTRIYNAGSLVKTGAGVATLTGTNTYTGTTTISAGELRINGSIANSAVTVQSGASLSGSGVVGAISGAGSINPGNSPGILTAPAVDPSGGLSFNFEFTSLDPTYSDASASRNDVLRLTDLTAPFTSALTPGNAVNIYFNVSALEAGQVYTGGFFTDRNIAFLDRIGDATFNYYVSQENGSILSNGVSYEPLGGGWSVMLSTVGRTADFTGGTVNGHVLQFEVVPEPGTLGLLLFAAAGLAGTAWRRRAASALRT
jgi:autotransporter-associated beta strand protein